MARFSAIPKPAPKRHTVALPVHGIESQVALRARVVADDDAIETAAIAYAKERGVENPKAGNPIYERGIALHTLLRTCSDPESPDGAPSAYFDNIDQISEGLDHDRIQMLLAAQEVWQTQQGGRVRTIEPAELLDRARDLTRRGPDAFTEMSPGLQWSVMRALAVMVVLKSG